jgi:hypothetical protein
LPEVRWNRPPRASQCPQPAADRHTAAPGLGAEMIVNRSSSGCFQPAVSGAGCPVGNVRKPCLLLKCFE